MDASDLVAGYVAGRVSPADFEQALYRDEAVERFLTECVPLPAYIGAGGLYLFLLEQDFGSSAGNLNAAGALAAFLEAKGIRADKPGWAEASHDLLLKLQPAWLRIPADHWQRLLSECAPAEGKVLESLLKACIKRDFRFLKTRPSWLQAPAWPFRGERPLLFVGQIDTSALRHDKAYVYLFLDERDGTYVTVDQAA